MFHPAGQAFQHPRFTRRFAIQAGAIGLLGLGSGHLAALQSLGATKAKARTVIYIFLSGGLSQLDSFDLKPGAPAEYRGEFKPIATKTTGIQICEHLPLLAQRTHLWSLVRSLTHPTNNHSEGHQIMLSGRTELPPAFSANMPKPSDWPSIAAIAGAATARRNNLPPAAILPDKLVHNTGRVIPGPYAGMMGRQREPWLIEASPFDPLGYGAYPEYAFDHQQRPLKDRNKVFKAPDLSLPEDLGAGRLDRRLALLQHIDTQRAGLEQQATVQNFDRFQQGAVSLLTDARVRQAFDVTHAEPAVQDRYGRNAFGWSLLMARRLVEAGVNLVQVNLGNNETWDTHGNLFPHLKDKLFPPTDKALSALLDDLQASGLLDETLIVMAGEFGRTPRIGSVGPIYKAPGRDHWGAVQSVFFAGGGVRGGTIIGASDKNGGYPADAPQKPENMAATIYRSLGIPSSAMWQDAQDRPHHIYHGEPISGLTR
ncbi:MAG: DUF1501 domain-containing protein [Gemmataceae bacterium]|nr:DUF1501 domain-containing protein [Gemmataceae bacterium]